MSSMLYRDVKSVFVRSAIIAAGLLACPAFAQQADELSPAATPPAPAVSVAPIAASNPMAGPLAQWNALRRADNLPFSSYANFMAVYEDWPGEATMRRNAERAIRPDVDSASMIISFFRKYPPQSPSAWLRYAEALDEQDRNFEAVEAARKAWTNGALSADDETRLLTRFGSVLRLEDHDARMDMLLWARSTTAAARQVSMTSATNRPTFDVRLALLSKAPDAPDKLAYAGRKVRTNPGFVADYIWWLRNTDQGGVARQMLRQSIPMSAFPPAPAVWLQMLLISAKDAAKDGDWQMAYDIASRASGTYPPGTVVRDRSFAERDAYTDLTWLAGMAALNRLGQPANAAVMFQQYANAAKSHQTQARGLYWAGRALEAAGKTAEARAVFENCARFFDQFHGQLAAERLGRKPMLTPTGRTLEISGSERAAFERRSLVRAIVALGQQGNWSDQSLFVRSLASSVETDAEHVLAAELASKVGRPDLNVLVGRNARNVGLNDYTAAAFPQIAVPAEHAGSWTMIHAISRQESQFDKEATSRVGARGLMQLMPATAKQTAPRAGLAYNYASLGDPQYNVALGATYFGQLMDMFGGSYVLAVAAYNAGPGNVNKWLRANGDPRSTVDVLDWIEAIPLSETRNYVQRVLENAVVYDMLNPPRATVKTATPLSTYLGKRYPG